ncbi:tigger transposable element-derived protein 7-like [Procambarus clarkii]|uniref:tigger transposable element-derived protein 7-like n=1 Tax=Procambarus clarkii TaxID=6728 RepID=UPI003742CF24
MSHVSESNSHRPKRQHGGGKTAAKFNIGKSTVSDIKKQKDTLFKYVSTTECATSGAACSRKTVKSGQYPQLDAAVYKWFIQHRTIGMAIRFEELKVAASKLAIQLGIKDFSASDGWVGRFKARHNISNTKNISGEASSADPTNVDSFKAKLNEYIVSNNLSKYQVYNADETGFMWRAVPSTSLTSRMQENIPGRKISKERLSVLLCANADASHRTKCAVVGKSNNPRALKIIMQALPVIYYNSKKSWFNQIIFTDWFENHFCKEVREFQINKCGIKASEVKALLLLDNAPAHPISKLISRDGRIKCMALPPNTTSLIQPLDQGVILAAKRMYQTAMLEDVLVVLPSEEDELTGKDTRAQRTLENLKKYTIREAIFHWARLWNKVKETTLTNSWKKLLTERPRCEAAVSDSEFEGFENEANDFEGFEETIRTMLLQAGQGVQVNDINEWLENDYDPGYELLTEEQIAQSVLENDSDDSDDSDDDSDDVGEALPRGVGYQKRLEQVEELIEYSIKSKHEVIGNFYVHLTALKQCLKTLARENQIQTKIDKFMISTVREKSSSTSDAAPVDAELPSTSHGASASNECSTSHAAPADAEFPSTSRGTSASNECSTSHVAPADAEFPPSRDKSSTNDIKYD